MLEDIKKDLNFFLDEFGSTAAVRRTLRLQSKEIERLEFQVRRLQGRRGRAPAQDAEESEEEKSEKDDVDRIQKDVAFFIEAFGSTRAVRERLERQKKEIEGLRRTVEWMEDRETRKRRQREAAVVPLVSVLADKVESLQTKKAKQRGQILSSGGGSEDDEEMNAMLYTLHDSETKRRTLGDLVEQTYSELMQMFPPVLAATGKRSLTSWNLPASNKKKKKKQRQEHHGHRIQSSELTAKDADDVRSASLVNPTGPVEHSRWLSPRKCKVRGCGKRQGLGGYCSDHDLNSAVGGGHCTSGGCKKRAIFRVDHRRNLRIPRSSSTDQPVSQGTPRSHKICKAAGCMKRSMGDGNLPLCCVDHQGWMGLENTSTENVHNPLHPTDDTNKPSATGLVIKRKGHTTCKVHRCMKWVTRDDSPYCINHKIAANSETPDFDSKIALAEETNVHSILHKNRATANEKATLKAMRRQRIKNRICKEPGCTKQAKRKGLCKRHADWIKCKAEGCEKHEYVQGYCHDHRRLTGRSGNLSSDEWASS